MPTAVAVATKQKEKRKPAVKEGEWHLVVWKGRQVAAQVLDIRESPHHPHKWEVYVHYANVDRRLDEWVTEDRIDPKPLPADGDNPPPLPVLISAAPSQQQLGTVVELPVAAPAAEPVPRKRKAPPSPPPVIPSKSRGKHVVNATTDDEILEDADEDERDEDEEEEEDFSSLARRKRARLSDGSAGHRGQHTNGLRGAGNGLAGRSNLKSRRQQPATEMWTDDESELAAESKPTKKKHGGRSTAPTRSTRGAASRGAHRRTDSSDSMMAGDLADAESDSDYAEDSDDSGVPKIASRTRARVSDLPSMHEIVAAGAAAMGRQPRHRSPPPPAPSRKTKESSSSPPKRRRGRPLGSTKKVTVVVDEDEEEEEQEEIRPSRPRRGSISAAAASATGPAPPTFVPGSPTTSTSPRLTAAERRRLEYRNKPRPVVLNIPRAAAVTLYQKPPPDVNPDEIKEVITGLFSGNVVIDKEREKEREESTKVKSIDVIQFGPYEINTWYFSPFPEEYRNLHKLYVCEYCLKYMKHPDTFLKHMHSCKQHRPPGRQVYHRQSLKIYEVDGKSDKLYCQNLCLLGKLFLDHKTVNYDIESFYFYVLVEVEQKGKRQTSERVLGYFSKEKYSVEGYNLACIIVFPQHQRRGLGRLLIEFSYAITKLEGRTGTPERPLSDLGLRGYRAYWEAVILDVLRSFDGGLRGDSGKKRGKKGSPSKNKGKGPATQQTLADDDDTGGIAGLPEDGPLTLQSISAATGIKHEDVVATLAGMGLLKYWNGPNGVNVDVLITREAVREFLHHKKLLALKNMIDPAGITWTDPNAYQAAFDDAKDM